MSSPGGVAGIGEPIAAAAWSAIAAATAWTCRSSAAVAAGDVDLDDYKEVAAPFSALTAEGMLQWVAESALRSIRASDVVARLGGDSFAVLLPGASPEAADTVIRKLQQSLRDASQETALPLCISGGVVTCVQPAESLEA